MSEMLRNLRWQDCVDILVIAYMIYRVLLLLRNTRAFQLVKGFFLVTVLSFIARGLALDTLSWLLNQILSLLFFAVPIIFQPELRKVLEELGRGGIWRRQKALARGESMADEVGKALSYLRAHKIGALVVLQRTTGLKDFWSTAVKLNAEITQELLISIFWVNNPLHDGAVILDTDEIIAAGCYLPLTENADLSRWLGTRHRAAIGVTEVSDCISLVVSEERGKISMAINGRLSQDLKDAQIRKLLVQYFAGADQTQQSLLESLHDEIRSLGDD
ncbi:MULTISPECIES: diadenylate cyclase CdaA [Jonquetella]|uniref:Diadenylate cyclase n=1 Tax=Jonquetella anthropi DSM 22815 TaxID=885272 RepID=H0UM69_9BACT|nr:MULTISPECIES: diadenylate cyclase CdaA [Jonquetella]EEX48202.1 TIGR00159 family protein [Jonquetella anthropi E3_33 E1]EHM13645.1 TIGR00159 family protein [Jonquetella anthropi DSM 22815]ERL24514.1 TIGR00159 family protein [Jonquetella sp. BV3C21]